jgi:hypothetical protein
MVEGVSSFAVQAYYRNQKHSLLLLLLFAILSSFLNDMTTLEEPLSQSNIMLRSELVHFS